MTYTWPSTRLAVSALLPNKFIDVVGPNAQLEAVAKQRGALFFDCGGGARRRRSAAAGRPARPEQA